MLSEAWKEYKVSPSPPEKKIFPLEKTVAVSPSMGMGKDWIYS